MTGNEVLIATQHGRITCLRCRSVQDGTGVLYGTYPDPARIFADLSTELSSCSAMVAPSKRLAKERSPSMRMIERWFPCTEVSEAPRAGGGAERARRALFTWFAARALAQAKAAVLTSLLPWPEDEPNSDGSRTWCVRR